MVTPVRPLSDPPDTNDPANFDARADLLFNTDLPNLVEDFNANVPALNELIASTPSLLAAANYTGDYSAAVTYLAGQSVTFVEAGVEYVFVAKKTNLGITPVNGNDWLKIEKARTPDFLLINSGVI